MRLSIPTFFVFILASQMMLGQSSPMQMYVEEALANNPDRTRAELAIKQQELRLKQANGLFLPSVALNATYTLAAGGRSIDFPVGDLLNPVYSTLNQLTETNSFPMIENVNEQFLPNNFQETNLRIIQPIFNPDIIANKRAQEILLDAEKTSLLITENELIRDVKDAYLGYLQAVEQVRIYQETEGLLREQIRVNERLIAANKVTPDAVSQAQLALSQWKGNLARAWQQEASARAFLNLLLGRDLQAEIIADTSLVPGQWTPELDQLLAGVLTSRSEGLFLDQQQDAQQWDLKRRQGQWLPSLNVVSDAGFQGFGYDFSDQGFILGQAALSWNLYQGGQRSAAIQEAEIEASRLNLQAIQLDRQLQLQVEQAYYGWIAARDGHEAAVEAEHHAARLYRQTNQRYLEGQVNALLLEQARSSWIQARLALNAAAFQWLSAENQLQFAAGKR